MNWMKGDATQLQAIKRRKSLMDWNLVFQAPTVLEARLPIFHDISRIVVVKSSFPKFICEKLTFPFYRHPKSIAPQFGIINICWYFIPLPILAVVQVLYMSICSRPHWLIRWVTMLLYDQLVLRGSLSDSALSGRSTKDVWCSSGSFQSVAITFPTITLITSWKWWRRVKWFRSIYLALAKKVGGILWNLKRLSGIARRSGAFCMYISFMPKKRSTEVFMKSYFKGRWQQALAYGPKTTEWQRKIHCINRKLERKFKATIFSCLKLPISISECEDTLRSWNHRLEYMHV